MGAIIVKSARDLLAKADLSLGDLQADGGYLQEAQAKKFIEQTIKESQLLQAITVLPMKSHTQQLDLMSFQSQILKPGVSGSALSAGDRSKPDLAQVELQSKLFKAEVHLNDEVVEDNIENGTFPQTVMRALTKALARDVEDVVINGDTGSGNPTLAVLDGILKQATSNIVDFQGARMNKDSLSDMWRTMPTRFKRMKREMRWLTSHNGDQDYRNSLASRATVAGDRFLLEDVPAAYGGIASMPLDVWPDTLGAGSNETQVLLANLKNIVYGIWRRIKIETDRDISAGKMLIVASVRFDVKFVEEVGVVLGDNVLN